MKVKVVAYTPVGTGEDPREPGEVVDVREAVAKEWVKQGWAIALPVEKKVDPETKAEVIETPEDSLPKHETASLKRKKK